MIYYGQERGMVDKRGPMRWHDGDADLTEFHRSLSTLRRAYPVLKTGGVERLSVDVAERREPAASESKPEDSETTADIVAPNGSGEVAGADRVAAFARDDGDDRLLVVLNFGDDPQAVSLPETVGSTDLRTGSPLRKRYAEDDPKDTYLLVVDVVICRSA